MALLRPLWLAGPTATGKSALSLLLAQQLGGEIITVDSMQVYRGMDIGTAKPSPADRAAVPHHLLDVVELSESFDVATFLRLARRAQQEIRERGRVPILCGGTGLYFRALLEGLGEAPGSDPFLRQELEHQPLPELLDELRRTDPSYYDRVDQANRRRIVRALEVIRLTGRPFSSQRAPWAGTRARCEQRPESERPVFFGVARDREDLGRRIDRRVDEMFAQGLVAEVTGLIPRGLASNRTAAQALGYRQVLEHLQGGASLEEARALVKIRTRRYAKRQVTWFRRQLELEWVEACEAEPAESLAPRLVERYRAATAGARD